MIRSVSLDNDSNIRNGKHKQKKKAIIVVSYISLDHMMVAVPVRSLFGRFGRFV